MRIARHRETKEIVVLTDEEAQILGNQDRLRREFGLIKFNMEVDHNTGYVHFFWNLANGERIDARPFLMGAYEILPYSELGNVLYSRKKD